MFTESSFVYTYFNFFQNCWLLFDFFPSFVEFFKMSISRKKSIFFLLNKLFSTNYLQEKFFWSQFLFLLFLLINKNVNTLLFITITNIWALNIFSFRFCQEFITNRFHRLNCYFINSGLTIVLTTFRNHWIKGGHFSTIKSL